jgi:hypothetical protein
MGLNVMSGNNLDEGKAQRLNGRMHASWFNKLAQNVNCLFFMGKQQRATHHVLHWMSHLTCGVGQEHGG